MTDADVDMSIFPLFALFAVSMGMPTVIPDMDTSRPLSADPRKICRVILDQGVSFSFGSPAFWDKMAGFCLETGVVLPSLRALLMAGCSVPGDLHERFLDHLLPPGGNVYVPYGATESLPLTTFSGTEVLMETRGMSDEGAGTCVGRKISDKVEIRIIKINDEEIPDWEESLTLPVGQLGEIVVKGVIVTKAYYERPDADAKAKIREGRYIWHRMGDIGYFDEEGRLWFCGRKVDRVTLKDRELYTDQCENIFNTHQAVRRSALIRMIDECGEVQAAIVVEPAEVSIMNDKTSLAALETELLELATSFDKTSPIKRVLFKSSFPVDVRHNAKIKREILTAWADSLPNR
ncbi:MAG: AMP-binding protein [Lentisphaeraceae bacterium]|nr:AMP-binding protein [Lentisphaeraceae bacterium]